MRSLTTSLIVVVLIATVGLGWLIDQFYDDYIISTDTNSIDAVTALEQIGSDLALTLSAISLKDKSLKDKSLKDELVKHWQSQNDYSLELTSASDFPITKQMLEGIKQGNALLLETDTELAIHFYLSVSDELLILKSPLIKVQNNESTLQYFLTFLFYTVLLILFLIWVYPLLTQLNRLRKASKSFGEGNLQQRIDVASVSYIRDIEIEFNHMAQRIENLVSDVKLLSSAVSHDLRTPLARIRFGIDTLQEETLQAETDPKLQQLYISKISNNVDEMTSLVETLLNYSRLDQNMLEIKKEKVNITTLINACIKSVSRLNVDIDFSEFKTESKTESEQKFYVSADKTTMHMLFTNLIQNAAYYGKGKVLIDITAIDENIIVNISDNGDGIALEQRENIFKPFCRGGEESKTMHPKGHGIGLAIVKRIVEWHQGDICVSDTAKLGGATFTLYLKAFTSS